MVNISLKRVINRILRYSPKGELTIEASIIVPLVMLIIAFIIGVAFYLHDITVADAYSYSRLIDSNNEALDKDEVLKKISNNTPLFMAKTSVASLDDHIITVMYDFNFPIRWVNNILKDKCERTIEYESSINIELLHICTFALNEK